MSRREQELVDAARCGYELVFSDLDPDELGASDDPAHLVRADLVRELLLGHRGPLDPRGVQLHGARIIGQLDLDQISAKVGVRLGRCEVGEPITACDAHLPWLDLSGSRLHTLLAVRVHVDGQLLLRELRISGSHEYGAILLPDAHIGGPLLLDNAEVANDTGPALHADRLQADSDVRLDSARLFGTGELGALRIIGARIGGQLDLDNVEITNDTGPALVADGLQADSDVRLDSARLSGTGELGALRIIGARIGGHFDLRNAEVANDTGPALHADRLQADSDVRLDSARLSGTGEVGAIHLLGARVGAQLVLDNAEVANDTGPALHADRLQADSDVRLDSARLFGTGELGAFRIIGARIGGQLDLDNVEITNDTGPALVADGLQADSDVRLDSARLFGTGELGALRLPGARIGAQLVLDNAEVTNDAGPALVADGLQADSDVGLDSARLSGTGELGAICLTGSRIGHFRLSNAEVTNKTGITIDLEDATVRHALYIEAGLVCPAPTRGSARCPHPVRVDVNGFTFGALAQIEWWEWLHVIRCHTDRYRPQPYQQLAAVERSAGHDGNVRKILITQQQDLYQRAKHALGGWWSRRFHWLWGALAGYGYRVRRTAVALLLVLLLAGTLGFWAGQIATDSGHRAAERTDSFTHRTGQLCSTVELIGVGLDRGLPLSPTGVRTRCDINTDTTWGQAFTVAIWLVQAAVWSLATLALAGYTGLIRKSS